MSSSANIPNLKPSRDVNEINKRLEDLRKGHCHLIGAGVGSVYRLETVPSGYEVNWHVFMFDPNPKGPHFYHDSRWGDGEVALKREALLEMWMAAGGRTIGTDREDDGRDPLFVRVAYSGAVMDFTGNWIPQKKSKEIDLRDGSATAKSISKPGQLSQQRQDINQLAESKAQNRVIRDLLNLRQKYSGDEAAWPFILMKLVLVPDMNDPITKMMVLANSFGSMNALFGNPETIKVLLNAGKPADDDDTPAATQIAGQQGGPRQIAAAAAAPTPPVEEPKSKERQMQEFGVTSPADQAKEIERLIALRVDETQLKKPIRRPINTWKPEHRSDFYKMLLDLPDLQKPEDDIPY